MPRRLPGRRRGGRVRFSPIARRCRWRVAATGSASGTGRRVVSIFLGTTLRFLGAGSMWCAITLRSEASSSSDGVCILSSRCRASPRGSSAGAGRGTSIGSGSSPFESRSNSAQRSPNPPTPSPRTVSGRPGWAWGGHSDPARRSSGPSDPPFAHAAASSSSYRGRVAR